MQTVELGYVNYFFAADNKLFIMNNSACDTRDKKCEQTIAQSLAVSLLSPYFIWESSAGKKDRVIKIETPAWFEQNYWGPEVVRSPIIRRGRCTSLSAINNPYAQTTTMKQPLIDWWDFLEEQKASKSVASIWR